MEYGEELCPNCWKETWFEVTKGEMIAKCEHCGKWIVLCQLCPTDCIGCGTCAFEQKCKELNEKEELCTI